MRAAAPRSRISAIPAPAIFRAGRRRAAAVGRSPRLPEARRSARGARVWGRGPRPRDPARVARCTLSARSAGGPRASGMEPTSGLGPAVSPRRTTMAPVVLRARLRMTIRRSGAMDERERWTQGASRALVSEQPGTWPRAARHIRATRGSIPRRAPTEQAMRESSRLSGAAVPRADSDSRRSRPWG